MASSSSRGPDDLIKSLVENYKEDKPLLEGVSLYRGSRLPDQAMGSFSQDETHASLLLQVAASYTHNWQEKDSFIGAYPIDRDKTRFFSDFGLEEHQQGREVRSYSVAEVERAIQPLVSNVAEAQNSRQWSHASEALEKYIKTNFYEAGVPARTLDGEPVRPNDLFIYTGKPDVEIRQAVAMQMDRVTPANEYRAKMVQASEARNEVGQQIHELGAQNPKAAAALKVIAGVAQRDAQDTVLKAHGHKPLNEFLAAAGSEPPTAIQQRLGKLAGAVTHSLGSSDPAERLRGMAAVREFAKLSPDTATLQDLATASKTASAVVEKVRASEAGSVGSSQSGSPNAKTAAPAREFGR